MPGELEQSERLPEGVGRHGRLSRDYAQVSRRIAGEDHPAFGPEPRQQGDAQPVGVLGRLGADYQQAVAELASNPAALFHVVMDERFDGAAAGWPNDPQGVARLARGGYRLSPRRDDQFAVVAAPGGSSVRDVLVGGTFRKLGGPSGGLYGLVLRQRALQGSARGRYYVAQVDDRGLVGIWRREQDTWLELVPWTPCTAVRPADAANDLSFEVVGGRLTFIVNGRPVASTHDAVLDHGGVGLFVGGEGNDVLVERFIIHAL